MPEARVPRVIHIPSLEEGVVPCTEQEEARILEQVAMGTGDIYHLVLGIQWSPSHRDTPSSEKLRVVLW